MNGGVATGRMELELALDVGQEGAGAEPEQIGAEVAVAEFFLDQREPIERFLGFPDSAGWFETDEVAGAFAVGPNGAGHDQSDRQGGVV